jgi:pimeloyl-ACP methyl ester carboxylesterase
MSSPVLLMLLPRLLSPLLLLAPHVATGLRHHQGLRAPPPSSEPAPAAQWFLQSLDHFRPSETRTWRQRYFLSKQHYREGGPTLLMIGGEGAANPAWMGAGSWQDYARQEGAAMVLLEHRFYGESRPTPDLGVKSMAWLSSRQALADLATFSLAMREQEGLTGPWVALGGSYPGALAVWYRQKYPHLVTGAVSSSAPLVAQADFPEYLEVVGAALDSRAAGCRAAVQEGLRRTGRLQARRVGWAVIRKKFRLCSNFNGKIANDVTSLFEALVGNFEGVVQYNRDNRDFEGAKWTNVTIDTVCGMMLDETRGDELDRLAAVNSLSLEMAGESCLDNSYATQVEELQATAWDSPAAGGGRQWTYQTCTEFGWYQSSNSPGHPWGRILPVKYFEKMCADIFGPKFSTVLLERGVAATNTEYGGLEPAVTNVVFVHGTVDPWHAIGRTTDLAPSAPAILIPGTAHCANMYPASEEDPPALSEARARVGGLIASWVRRRPT